MERGRGEGRTLCGLALSGGCKSVRVTVFVEGEVGVAGVTSVSSEGREAELKATGLYNQNEGL